ncbi:MAG: ACP S-malonyltransferase [bacterium]|nr:MAG: ACP S-malonyltransferase [bacterium]
MKTALIFPGQGSQYVGMGKDLAERYREIAGLYEEADEVLGFRISRLSFQGDQDFLRETRNAQPAILLHSVAVCRLLTKDAGITPAIVAGHSLGEYSALVAAGVLDALDALRIVRKRGELMYDAGLAQPGTMAAIMGLEREACDEICRDVSGDRVVVVANINSPRQVVVSGHVEAVEEAMTRATERGARKVVRLNVSGAFHSPLVTSAQEELVSYMRTFTFNDAAVDVICNVDAAVIRKKDKIIDALSRQLTNPVLWSDSMKILLERWEGDIMEIGPGRVLAGLMRQIDRGRQVRTAGVAPEVERFVAPSIEVT